MAEISEEVSQQSQLAEGGDIEAEEELFAVINELIAHGFNAGDVKKLQNAGIITYNDLMMKPKEHLAEITETEAQVDKICEAAEMIVSFGYIRGTDALLKAMKFITEITPNDALLARKVMKIMTGITPNDPLLRRNSVILVTTENQAQLLGGGIETYSFTGMEKFRSKDVLRSKDAQLEKTPRISTMSGDQLVSFIPGLPPTTDLSFLMACHVKNSHMTLYKYAMKIAFTPNVSTFINSLEDCVKIFISKEQIYFRSLVEVEYKDMKLSEKELRLHGGKSQEGTSNYEGTRSALSHDALKMVDFWGNVLDLARNIFWEKALKWEPYPTQFTFVLAKIDDWEVLLKLKKMGVWIGNMVQLSPLMKESERKKIETEAKKLELELKK